MLIGALEGFGGAGADFINVVSKAAIPFHVVTFGAFGKAFTEGGGAFEAGAHGVAVVFDDIDHGQIPEGGEVKRFMEGTLVDSTVSHVAEGGTLDAFVFESESETRTQGCLAADDAVASPEVFIGGEVVHGASFAFGAAGGFAEELGHAFVHGHADHEGMSVVAVSGDKVVVFLVAGGDGADGYGFLADVEVQESADVALLVGTQGTLLEATDANHVAVEGDFVLFRESLVDGMVCEGAQRDRRVIGVFFIHLGGGHIAAYQMLFPGKRQFSGLDSLRRRFVG